MDYSSPDSSVHGISQAKWNVLPFLSPGDLPHPGIKLRLLHLQGGSLPLSHLGIPILVTYGEIRVSTLGHFVLVKLE